MVSKLNTLSDFNLAVRLRDVVAEIDSGEPFWVWDDTGNYHQHPDQPNRIARGYVGIKPIGTVSIWFAIPYYDAHGGAIVAHSWSWTGRSSVSTKFDGADDEQLAAAMAWVEKQWR